MGNTNVSITVPSADGSGASADLSALGPDKTFVYAGTLVGSVTIEVSNDGSNWAPLITLSSPQEITLSAVANYARATVSGYRSGTGALSVGGESTSANVFSAVNVPASNGNGTALDVSTYGPLKTFTWGGGTASFNGSLTVTVSQDGTNYMPLFTLSGITGVFTTSTPCDYVRVTRSGGTTGTAPSLAVGAFNADASGGAGFVPMGGPNFVAAATVRSGRGIYVNPADPNAADDSNWQTPKLTITGAIAAIVAAGPPTNVATSMMRWVMFVAPGCYDEDVTIPASIPHLTMVSMGGVTLGDGDTNGYGDSTTARNLTWQVNNDYKFATDAFNNPIPENRLFITTMTDDNMAVPFWATSPTTTPGTETSMDGWRISGNILIEDDGVGTPYEDYIQIYLRSVTADTVSSTLSNAGYPVFTMFGCSITTFTNTANGTLADAQNCRFGGPGGTGNFYTGNTYRMNDCQFLAGSIDFGSCNASLNLLTNLKINANIATLVAWTGTLVCDANTLFEIGNLSRTVVAYATSGDILCVDTPSTFIFGNTDIAAAAGDVYLTPGFQAAAAGASDDKQLPVTPSAGSEVLIVQGFSVRHNLNAGNGNNVTYELLINGASAATPITAVLATAAVGQAHSSAKPAFATTSARLSIKATKPGGGIGSGVQNVTAVVRCYVRTQG